MSGSAERDRLLDLVADHVLEHGTSTLSLSGIARAVGSNNRMLLYYFVRKEDLLDEACQRAVRRFPVVGGALDLLRTDDHLPDDDLAERLQRTWAAITHPDNLPFLRLFFERYGSALRDPAENTGYLDRMGLSGWPTEIAEILRVQGVEPTAARRAGLEVVALWRGLQLALLAGVPAAELDEVHRAAVTRLAADPALGGRNRVAPQS